MIVTIIRCVITAALLWVVWHNAHWSVALTLTTMSLGIEFQSALWRRVVALRAS